VDFVRSVATALKVREFMSCELASYSVVVVIQHGSFWLVAPNGSKLSCNLALR
jgi:hypothetical protein